MTTPLAAVLTESIELAKSEKRHGIAIALDAILWDMHVLADRLTAKWCAISTENETRESLTTAAVDANCAVANAEFELGVWRRKLSGLLSELAEAK